MTHWLSYWNKPERLRKQSCLPGHPVEEIFVPWGWDVIEPGDVVYCFFVEGGKVHLVTKVTAPGKLTKDDKHNQSVSVVPVATRNVVPVSFQRTLKVKQANEVKYECADGTIGEFKPPSPYCFQGRASLRKLLDGKAALNERLGEP